MVVGSPHITLDLYIILHPQIRRPGQADRLQGRCQRGRQRQAHPRAQGGDTQAARTAQGRRHRGGRR